MRDPLMMAVESKQLQAEPAKFEVGDTVDVYQRILEGQKERVQVFNGVVISKTGTGLKEAFTVRRVVQGEGVERVFLLHSPKISKIEVKRTGETRRAKLYFLRDRVGKATRLRERKSSTPAGVAAKKAGAASRRKKPEDKAE